MDKGRRTELTKLKYKKRLKQLGLKEGEGKFTCYKSTGKPCSCEMCSPYKYNRTEKHKKTISNVEFDDKFDKGEDILEYLELDKIKRGNVEE